MSDTFMCASYLVRYVEKVKVQCISTEGELRYVCSPKFNVTMKFDHSCFTMQVYLLRESQ